MRLERLTKSIRKGLATGLLGLSFAGAGGCAATLSELTEGEEMTLLGSVMGASSDSLPIKLAPYISLLGQMRYQKEIVREGRTQINISPGEQTQNQRAPENIIYSEGEYFPAPGFAWANPENPNDLTLRRSMGVAFAANYWRDFDNDGLADPNEFVGVKDKFYDTEDILLVLYGEQGAEREIRYEIYDPKGRLYVGQEGDTSTTGKTTTAMGATAVGLNFNLTNWLIHGWRWEKMEGNLTKIIPLDPNDGRYGNYVIVWHSNGATETKQFEIVPSPARER